MIDAKQKWMYDKKAMTTSSNNDTNKEVMQDLEKIPKAIFHIKKSLGDEIPITFLQAKILHGLTYCQSSIIRFPKSWMRTYLEVARRTVSVLSPIFKPFKEAQATSVANGSWSK